MKLSDLYHIDEGRKIIDTGEIGLQRKTWVLENPSAANIVDALDQMNKDSDGSGSHGVAAGWTGGQGTWVWDRMRIDHFTVAHKFGIDNQKSIPFYIRTADVGPNNITLDVTFEVSEYSGRKSFDSLMRRPIIIAIMQLLAQRREMTEPEYSKDDDYTELLGSLTGSDY